jgi:hypothetical protein
MKNSERAAQVWSVLALAARNRQTLTYEMLAGLTGIPQQGIGPVLDPVQDYCAAHNLPALSSIVVKKQSGIPSHGFVAASDVPSAQAAVFAFDWIKHGCPKPEALEAAPPVAT